jgi:anti-anti-sigma factor
MDWAPARRSVLGMHTLEIEALIAEIGPDEYVVAVNGDVDLRSAPLLEGRLDALLADGAQAIVLDLRSARFVDEEALGVLTRTATLLAEHGGRLVLASDSRELLSFLGAGAHGAAVAIRPTLMQAIDVVRSGKA